MATNSIHNAFVNALLADATYRDGLSVPGADLVFELSPRLTPALANYLADRFEVVTQKLTDESAQSGFDVTVWREKATGQIYLSTRGTEPGSAGDLSADVDLSLTAGLARRQVVDMVNWWLKGRAPAGAPASQIKMETTLDGLGIPTTRIVGADSVTGDGTLIFVTSIITNGHSLGGHLANAFARLFSGSLPVLHTYTYNSATFNSGSPGSFAEIAAALGLGATQFPSNGADTNFRATHGADVTTQNLTGGQIGLRVDLFNEESFGIPNHFMYKLTDALALGDFLSTLAPSLDVATLNKFYEASTNHRDDALEKSIDGISKILRGIDPHTPIGDVGDRSASRDAFHTTLAALRIAPAGIAGRFTLSLASNALATSAKTNFGAFLSLNALSTVVISTTDPTALGMLKLVNTNLEDLWRADTDLRAAGSPVANFTDRWMSDRTSMLTKLVERNKADLADSVVLNDTQHRSNRTYIDFATGQTISTRGYANTGGAEPQQILFGNELDNGLIGSDALTSGEGDSLYGGAGNDYLDGKGGDDYLEGASGEDTLNGGAGSDVLIGGAGNDTYQFTSGEMADTIRDSDGNGTIMVGTAQLTGGKKDGANYWVSDDLNWGYMLTSTGDLVINNVSRGAFGDDRIVVQNWLAAGGDKLGIVLSDTPAPAPVPGAGLFKLHGDQALLYSALIGPDDWLNLAPDGTWIEGMATPGSDDYYWAGQFRIGDDLYADRGPIDYDGRAGNDVIIGYNSADKLSGGEGNDVIFGASGSDRIDGGAGMDFIMSNSKAVMLVDYPRLELGLLGITATPWIEGSWDYPVEGDISHIWDWTIHKDNNGHLLSSLVIDDIEFVGGVPRSLIENPDDADFVLGGAGDDFIWGGLGQDIIDGEGDNDQIQGLGGADELMGGLGDDSIWGDDNAHPAWLLWDEGAVAQLKTPPWQVVKVADHGDDVIDGGAGNDTLTGDGGSDVLYGGADNDALWGDTSASNITTPEDNALIWGDDYLDGEDGDDMLIGGGKDDTLFGGVGTDTLLGDQNNALLSPEYQGFDYLDGEDGNDLLIGGGKDDNLFGGAGNDELQGDTGIDFLPGASHGSDYLDGEAGDDKLFGQGSADILMGGAGDDDMFGDAEVAQLPLAFHGADFMDGGAGDDQMVGGGGNDTMLGGEGSDQMWGEEGDDSLDGGVGLDYLFGEAGNDTLISTDGVDYLDGGEGDDTYLISNSSGMADAPGTLLSTIADTHGHNTLAIDGVVSANATPGGGTGNVFISVDGRKLVVNDGMKGAFATISVNGQPISMQRYVAQNVYETVALSPTPGAVDPTLWGGSGNDTLSSELDGTVFAGGLGNDFMSTTSTNNTIIFDRGDGADTIQVGGVVQSGDASNTLTLGVGIARSDVQMLYSYTRELRIYFSYENSIDSIVVKNVSSALGVDKVRLADGTEIDVLSELESRGYFVGRELRGGEGADVLTGGRGDDVLYGGGGDDALSGGGGIDALYGQGGSDTYLFGYGDGTVTIYNYDSDTPGSMPDTVQLGAGVTLADLSIRREFDTLVVQIKLTYDVLRIDNYLVNSGGTAAAVDWIRLADGTGLDVAAVKGILTTGTDGSDMLYGFDGNDIMRGGPGYDYLVGGAGDDLYIYNVGDGEDDIVDAAGNDRIVFGAGITAAQISASHANNRVTLTLSGSGRINFAELGGGTFAVEQFQFADGGVLDAAWLNALLNAPPSGTDLAIASDEDTGYAITEADFGFSAPNASDVLDAVRIDSLPAAGSLELAGVALEAGQLVGVADIAAGNLVFTPAANDNGSSYTNLRFTVKDQSGALDLTPNTLTFNITPVNDAPIGALTISGVVTQYQTLGAVTTLADPDGMGTLGYQWQSSPSGATWTAIGGANAGSFTLTAAQVGKLVRVVATYTDAQGTVETVTSAPTVAVASDLYRQTGTAGADTLAGTTGADRLEGLAGDDTYVVNNAGDIVVEALNEGTDLVQSSVTYTLGANLENLSLTGSSAIKGTGNALDNVLTGNSGANVLTGGAGNDTYIVGTGDSTIELAGGGVDAVQSAVTWTLGAEVENLTLTGTTAINGTGNSLANTLTGNSGANILDGGSGADTMVGGAGNDTYTVDNAADVITEAASAGTDTVLASLNWTLATNLEKLTLTGTGDINATGNGVANVLTGNAGNNVLTGGAGTDTLVGGAGDDTYVLDVATDVVTEALNAGTDTVQIGVTYTLGANVENLTLTGSSAIKATGNALANVLTGNSGANVMTGGAGNDTYLVGTGDSAVELAGGGTDTVQSAITWTLGTELENLTLTGSGAVNGTGNTLANVLTGNSGNNTLTGAAGNDTLDGGAGADVLVGGAGNDTFRLGRGYGADTLQENDATAGNTDVLQFLSGVAIDQVWFRHVGNNLEVSIIGTSDKMTLTNWYSGSNYHVEQIATADGKVLQDSQVEALVTAMAPYAAPALGQLTLPADYWTALSAVITGSWH